MRCEECLPLIEEYVDGELDARMVERVAAHLSTCADCAHEFAELSREQEIYALYQRDVEVTPSQWNIISARIEQEKDARLHEPGRAQVSGWLSGLFGSRKEFRPAFVAALLLIAIGITAGVIYLNSPDRQSNLASQPSQQNKDSIPAGVKGTATPEGNENRGTIAQDGNREKVDSNRQATATVNNPADTATQKRTVVLARLQRSVNRRVEQLNSAETVRFEEAVARDNTIADMRRSIPDATGDFDFEIARHAERAQLLLRSFRNVRPLASNRALDVSYEKDQSRKLLYQNISLKRDAVARGDQATAELLNTLEPILLDIAHLPDRAKSRDVRSIEQRMEKKEIVATLQVRTLVASN